MANTFTRYTGSGITTATTVLTATTTTTVIGLSIANTGASDASVDVQLNGTYLIKGADVPVGSAVVVIGGDQKLVMIDTDTIVVTSTISVDAVISVLEIT